MAYKALTYVVLGETRKAPGDTITDKELKDSGQGEEEIRNLISAGAIGDKDADINENHVTEDAESSDGKVNASDAGGGKE